MNFNKIEENPAQTAQGWLIPVHVQIDTNWIAFFF